MCKFCNEDWNQRHTVQAKTDGVFSSYGGMQVDDGCIAVNVGGSVARFPINYCPVCGRKLEEKPRIPESEYNINEPAAPWDGDAFEDLDALEERVSYTAFLYESDGETAKELYTFENKDRAVEFAKSQGWDEVVEDITGAVVWKK